MASRPRDSRNTPAIPERSAEEILDALETRERAFVRGLLRGETCEQATLSATWTDARTGFVVLGRPHVRDAILALAPLLAVDDAGEKRARELMRPYALACLASHVRARGPGALAAARDLLDSTASEPANLRRALEQRARARGGGADNPRYGTPGPGNARGPGDASA